jgi:hypothetical protein
MVVYIYRSLCFVLTDSTSVKPGTHWIGSAQLGTEQSVEVKLNGNPRITSALLGTDL